MAPTWFSHRGPGVGRVRVLRLLHRVSVPGSNLKVGWAPVRNLLWCCLGVQPSVGASTALAHRGREHIHGQYQATTPSTWFTRNCVLLLSQEQEIKAGEHIIPVSGCWTREGLLPLVTRRESLCDFYVQIVL